MTGQSSTFGSAYLEHLSHLAKEAKQRSFGVPPFNVMIGLAVIAHLTVLVPIYFLTLAEDIPETKQIRLAFGVEKKVAPAEDSAEQEKASESVLDKIDNLFSPPKPQPAPRPKAVERQAPRQQPRRQVVQPQETRPTPTQQRSRERQPQLRRPASSQTTSGNSSSTQASSGSVQEIITKYEQLLSGWINSHRANQTFALPQGLHGRTVVRIRINRRGFVTRKSVERSSGYRELDQAALDAVGRASPVPAVPEEYPGGAQLEFLIPINIIVN